MLISSFLYVLLFCIISFVLCCLGVLFSYYTQSPEIANALFHSYIFAFNGILIFGVGYGVVWFTKNCGKGILNQVYNLVNVPEDILPKIVVHQRRASSWVWSHFISVPVTVIGGIILWNCGYPLEGFAKYFLAACSIALYYAGGYLLSFFIHSTLIFKTLEDQQVKVSKRVGATELDIDTLNYFFIIVSTLGVVGLYLAFRGTLTANFTILDSQEFVRKLLVFPIILFLPAPLLFSFYPRFVLKGFWENDIIRRISEIEEQSNCAVRESVSPKEKLEILPCQMYLWVDICIAQLK